MSRTAQISTEEIENKIEQFRVIDLKMGSLFKEIEEEINSLKPYWESKTADLQYSDFSHFLTQMQNVRSLNQSYLQFLKNSVQKSYEEEEKILLNNITDESLDIKG